MWGICIFGYDMVIHRGTFIVVSFDKNINTIKWVMSGFIKLMPPYFS